MDLDAAADELYGVSPDEFVERRKALVAQARQAQDRELVRQIGALRRPTRTGWLGNLLARAEPDRITELLELGQALGDAQQRRSGTDLRRLSAERRTMVDQLARRAVELGREQDYQAPDAAHQELAQTLQAALGDPEVADLLRLGRLTQATSYGGFGMGDLSTALAASLPGPEREREPATEPDPEPEPEPEPGPSAAEQRRMQRRQQSEAAREAAQQALTAGESEAEQATAAADELADQVETLRSRLVEAEAAEHAGRERARAARKQLTELRQAFAAAEAAVAEAADGLGD